MCLKDKQTNVNFLFKNNIWALKPQLHSLGGLVYIPKISLPKWTFYSELWIWDEITSWVEDSRLSSKLSSKCQHLHWSFGIIGDTSQSGEGISSRALWTLYWEHMRHQRKQQKEHITSITGHPPTSLATTFPMCRGSLVSNPQTEWK